MTVSCRDLSLVEGREGHTSADARRAAGGDVLRQGMLPGFCMDQIYAMLHFLWVALRDPQADVVLRSVGIRRLTYQSMPPTAETSCRD